MEHGEELQSSFRTKNHMQHSSTATGMPLIWLLVTVSSSVYTLMKNALDVVMEVIKLVKKSPKRDAMFERLKGDLEHQDFVYFVPLVGQ